MNFSQSVKISANMVTLVRRYSKGFHWQQVIRGKTLAVGRHDDAKVGVDDCRVVIGISNSVPVTPRINSSQIRRQLKLRHCQPCDQILVILLALANNFFTNIAQIFGDFCVISKNTNL